MRDYQILESLLRKVDKLLSDEAKLVLNSYREFPYGLRYLNVPYMEKIRPNKNHLFLSEEENTDNIRYDRYWYSYFFMNIPPIRAGGAVPICDRIVVHKHLILANFRDRWYGVMCGAFTKDAQ